MIGYATLGSNNMGRARAFYDALLSDIGAQRLMDLGDDSGGMTMWGTSMDRPALAVMTPENGSPATVGNGTMIALAVDERAKVDALHVRALELGGSDEGAPGLRGAEAPQAFYGAYFRDLDGNKLCAFRMAPAS